LYGARPACRDAIAALGRWYFTAVACATLIWRRQPAVVIPPWAGKGRKPTRQRLKTPANQPDRVDELLHRGPTTAWVRGTIKAGSKGPMGGDFAFVRVTEVRHGVPGARVWLIIRRNVADPTAVTLYLSTAPDAIELTVLVRMGGLRWPIALP